MNKRAGKKVLSKGNMYMEEPEEGRVWQAQGN